MPRIIEVWHNGDSRVIHIQIAICVWTIFALFTRDRMQIMDLRAGWGIRFRENAKVEAVFEELSPWIAPWAAKQDDVPLVLKVTDEALRPRLDSRPLSRLSIPSAAPWLFADRQSVHSLARGNREQQRDPEPLVREIPAWLSQCVPGRPPARVERRKAAIRKENMATTFSPGSYRLEVYGTMSACSRKIPVCRYEPVSFGSVNMQRQ